MIVERIKYQYRIIDQRAGIDQPPLMAVSIHHGVVPRDTLTDDLPRAEDLSNYKLCERGDIVLNRMRAFQGAIGISPQRGLVSPDYLVLRPGPDSDARYLHHLFRSTWFVGEMVSRLRGIGNTESGAVRTPRINPEDLGDIPVTLPPIDEQRRIADFLDAETARLDELIALIMRQANALDDRRQAAIDAETGRGGEPVPLKYVARVDYGLGQPPRLSEAGIPILRATNIKRGKFTSDGLIFSAIEDLPLDRAPLLREGEILVVRSGAGTGDSAMVTSKWAGSAPGYDLRVTPISGVSRYIAYCLLSRSALDLVDLAKSRAAQPHLNAEDLGGIPIRMPPLDEQERIANILDIETSRISQLTEIRKRQFAVLTERRQALITAAVTGQIGV